MFNKILFVVGALVSIASAALPTCMTDSDCTGSVCVRSLCLSTDSLKHLAETYVPQEALTKVAHQAKFPECKQAYDCDAPFDRCLAGGCLSDEAVAIYRSEVSNIYNNQFSAVIFTMPSIEEKKCVSNSQCLAGEMCY